MEKHGDYQSQSCQVTVIAVFFLARPDKQVRSEFQTTMERLLTTTTPVTLHSESGPRSTRRCDRQAAQRP